MSQKSIHKLEENPSMAKKAAATATAKETPADAGVILQLDPNTILADDNTRYNLKESRIITLADSILSQGGVIEPIEVEPLAEAQNGYVYRLTLGFYRHAAVKHLNTTQAAGLTIPALVHVTQNPVERLKRQLAENIERENQSPMDQAIAIKKLMDIGTSRIEIRNMFSRPGGRKGSKVQPASNSFINMTMSFLELPKSAQQKIHEGIVGVRAAYMLTKVDPDKRAEVLERAEEERRKQLEQEEKDEERFLNQEKRRQEQAGKVESVKAALDAAEAKNLEAAKVLEQQTELTAELFRASKGKHANSKDKKAADAAFKDAEKVRAAAEEKAEEAQKAYERAQVAYSKLTETKPAPKPATKKPVSDKDIQKAAAQTGAAQGAVPLNRAEMIKVILDMTLPGGNDTVIAIGRSLQNCFAGITTPDQCYKELTKIVK